MDCEKELEKQYEACDISGYFFFIPERSLFNFKDLLINDVNILLFKPVIFKKAYFELINECSVADTSEDTNG